MAKLPALIDCMVSALQVPASRVRTAAAELRKHRLIRTGPRGPGAPEMRSEDATALLLALMYDDELASASLNVSLLLQARFGGSTQVGGSCATKELPQHSFLRTGAGETAPFGEVLNTMLDWWTRRGSICEEDAPDGSDRSVYNLTIEVQSPGHIGSIRFDTHEAMWNLRYHWKPPEQVAYEAAALPPGHDFRTRWDALNGPYLWSSRTVSEDSLTLIADCLRGYSWLDDSENEATPQDAGNGALEELRR